MKCAVVFIPRSHKAAVAVVLHVISFYQPLDRKYRCAKPVGQPQQCALDEVNRLRRRRQVVQLAETFRIRLYEQVVEVPHQRRSLAFVPLGDEVLGTQPVDGFAVCKRAQLLQGEAFAHGTGGEGLALHAHQNVVSNPLASGDVEAKPYGTLHFELVESAGRPRVSGVVRQNHGATPHGAQVPTLHLGGKTNRRGRRLEGIQGHLVQGDAHDRGGRAWETGGSGGGGNLGSIGEA
mmetsp:Transcript_25114/g.45506  ORF Transcript_25114/g.45506 Transcript_25114/m.45506 type:complete len:235 (+) Transcript_25114:734-1438(+)